MYIVIEKYYVFVNGILIQVHFQLRQVLLKSTCLALEHHCKRVTVLMHSTQFLKLFHSVYRSGICFFISLIQNWIGLIIMFDEWAFVLVHLITVIALLLHLRLRLINLLKLWLDVKEINVFQSIDIWNSDGLWTWISIFTFPEITIKDVGC